MRLDSSDGGVPEVMSGMMNVAQYSGDQYVWDPEDGPDAHGRPAKNLPPLRETRNAEEGAVLDLPPNSITVVTMAE